MQETLQAEATARGIVLDAAQVAQFEALYAELVEWNQRFNLTRIVAYEAVQIQHYLDALSLLVAHDGLFAAGTRVIDVGTGAGFPGLALKIARPGLRVTLADAVGKKVTFIEHVIERLGLAETRAVHARAEDLGRMAAHRARYDVALARAVADLPALMEYLLPLVRVGGVAIAQKGARIEDEMARAATAIGILGGGEPSVKQYTLPGLDELRTVVMVPKRRATPGEYPRRAGVPTRIPLDLDMDPEELRGRRGRGGDA